jgi:acetylglutamate kinase
MSAAATMEALEPALPGISEEARRQHNRNELLRVFPDSPQHLARFISWAGHQIVIKFGGEMVDDPVVHNSLVVMQDVGLTPVIVHGGGDQITEAMAEDGHESVIENGVRLTLPEHMDSVVRALDTVNETFRANIERFGGRTEGVSGIFKGVVSSAHDRVLRNILDVDTAPVIKATMAGKIAIVSCLGSDFSGKVPLNVNGDTAAGVLAEALGAKKALFVTEIGGVQDKNHRRIPQIDPVLANQLILDEVIDRGMIPKLQESFALNHRGVHDVVLTRDFMGELFTDGEGTIVHLDKLPA